MLTSLTSVVSDHGRRNTRVNAASCFKPAEEEKQRTDDNNVARANRFNFVVVSKGPPSEDAANDEIDPSDLGLRRRVDHNVYSLLVGLGLE